MQNRAIKTLVLSAAVSLTAVSAGAGAVWAEEVNAEAVEAAAEEPNVEEADAAAAEELNVEEMEAAGAAEAGNGAVTEVSCNLFSVTVPAEIAQISDIEVTIDGIAFYEKLARPEFGGFVGRITTYQNVEDYCYTPSFGRGGEIIRPDGRKVDVVLVYPSDVQSDIQNQESMDNWRKIRDALDGPILESMTPCEGGEYIPQDQVDNTEVYDGILDTLAADLQEEKDEEGLAGDGFSALYTYLYGGEENPLDMVEYGFVDITGTGYPELVIMQKEDSVVCDMFAQVKGEAVHLFSSTERDRYSLSGSYGTIQSIREDASDSADKTTISFFDVDPLSRELYLQVNFIYDATEDPENPWFIKYAFDEETEPMSEEDWQQRISNFGEEGMRPEMKTLSER